MADHDRGGEVTIPGAGGGQGRPVPPARAVNAGPAAEDDVTVWLGDVGSQAPGTAPAGPGLPSPVSRRRVPLSTPAGMFTFNFFSIRL